MPPTIVSHSLCWMHALREVLQWIAGPALEAAWMCLCLNKVYLLTYLAQIIASHHISCPLPSQMSNDVCTSPANLSELFKFQRSNYDSTIIIFISEWERTSQLQKVQNNGVNTVTITPVIRKQSYLPLFVTDIVATPENASLLTPTWSAIDLPLIHKTIYSVATLWPYITYYHT